MTKKYVYVLTRWYEYEDETVLGVYSTLELAEVSKLKEEKEYPMGKGGGYGIEKYTLDPE